MRQLYFLAFLPFYLLFLGCSTDGEPAIDHLSMGQVTVTLTGLEGVLNDFDVILRNTQTGSLLAASTDAAGIATFSTPPGIYEATATGCRAADGVAYNYNGVAGQVIVRQSSMVTAVIAMKAVRRSQVIIKELYNGGCMADDGVTKYQFDKYVILYNNSSQTATLPHLCLGFLTPYNAQSNNNNYNADGRLTYEAAGFTPVLDGIWYFPDTLRMEPYEQVVVNIHGAIDNSQAYSQSVNFSHQDYYCMYDPESGYINSKYYPTPSAIIPTSHYLKACRWSQSNAWPLSVTSPALLLFQIQGVLPADYVAQVENQWYDGGEIMQTRQCLKIPNQWIADAIEVFASGYKDSSVKRLAADVDAGYVWLTNYQGHSLYRNVDQTATESLPENEGKIVYGYGLGVGSSTDLSGIDAEASALRGAHIVYMDTNNSTNDYHERRLCSLRK